jgi:hypothetical protein
VTNGADESSGAAALSASLARRVKQLVGGETLVIAELAEAGVIRWEVRRSPDGIARLWYLDPVRWEDLYRDGLLSAEAVRAAAEAASDALAICTAPAHVAAEQALTVFAPPDQSLVARVDVRGLLTNVLRNDPITMWYELLVQRQLDGGYLDTVTIPLFPPGARRGDEEHLSVQCEPSDTTGTVFTVVARDHMLDYQLISKQSAVIPPGSYELTAKLLRPGKVRFSGIPADLRDDPRDWDEIARTVPGRLELPPPAHLIVALESSGAAADVRERFGRAEQLVRYVARQPDHQVLFSLLCYGPHAVHRSDPDVPVKGLVWRDGAARVLGILGRLASQDPEPLGYPAAAQIECLLAGVIARLGPGSSESRPVLVTIGARPAFPDRVNFARVIPCRRHSWRTELRQLQQYPGITFGAIRDRGSYDGYDHARGPEDEVWDHLGATAFAWLDAVDVPGFAARLGLVAPARPPMPLPYESAGGM